MSSFIIGKAEYMKMAGFVTGIAKGTENTPSQFWLWDDEHGRNMNGRDYIDKFTECYKMNVDSVNNQYGDSEPYDEESYDVDFRKYFYYGLEVCRNKPVLLERAFDLVNFAKSVAYQIEDATSRGVVMEFFNEIIVQIFRVVDGGDRMGSWGKLEFLVE